MPQDTVILSLWRRPSERTFVSYLTLRRVVHMHRIADFPDENRSVWTGWIIWNGHQVLVEGECALSARPTQWRGNRNLNMTF